MEIQVRAIPAPGNDVRLRAGRAWGKNPIVVKVVDEPKAADEISHAQFALLKEDVLHINAVPVGEANLGSEDDKIARVKAETELAKLKLELAQFIEEAEEQHVLVSKDAEKTQALIRELEAENARLKAQIVSKAAKK